MSNPKYERGNFLTRRYLQCRPSELSHLLIDPSDCSWAGKAYPDVSAEGVNFEIVFSEETGLVDGTSCSSPTFTAFVSLLNDARLASGKSALGFLNPLIYALNAQTVTGFNDITVGNNPGCGTEGFNVSSGVQLCGYWLTDCDQATVGWDPVTGWGTPNFGVLKDLVLAL